MNHHFEARLQALVDRLRSHEDFASDRRARTGTKGITRVLHDVYYPKYNFRRCLRRESAPENVRPAVGSANGMRRGRLVDGQLCDLVRRFRTEICRDSTIARMRETGRLMSFRGFVEREAPRHLHLMTRAAIRRLNRMNLLPVDAQVLVGDTESLTRTAVDVLCVLKRDPRKAVLVELKCGFDRYLSLSSGKMRFELRAVDNSPQNQHHLQLAVTRELYARAYASLEVPTGLVLWINNDGNTRAESVRPWAIENVDAVLRRMRGRIRRSSRVVTVRRDRRFDERTPPRA
ncbi:hypothetical protein CYMTET_35731 [Cymbomonas tetramitiformis]|uniref:Uncharacterized protein n=1 Tax=Cymbomonas tetramitiformis TaxID=36881 RepID=A0AAE0F8S4_9CHLO|nr:hypothetical protein CYMTET_35731 [Cymbomonas tetramitiformis]|eukprot:gene186-326_t